MFVPSGKTMSTATPPTARVKYGARRVELSENKHSYPVCGDAMVDKDSSKTHFGYTEVAVEDKARLVGEVFSSVASSYDIMNDLMSFGVHRLWKRHFVRTAAIQSGAKVLDIAGGTGDIARLLLPRVGHAGQVVLSDINPEMLAVGRARMEDKGLIQGLDYVLANAEELPFEDSSFDAVTIAFGLRNVTDKNAALREMYRVIKPGGQVNILEFSSVNSKMMEKLYEVYSFSLLPKIGAVVAKDEDSYRYLAESIRKHPDQETLAEMLRDAGFSKVSYENITNGVVAIHRGYHV